MTLSFIYLFIGVALILYGANWLTDGASSIAKRMHIPDLIIGLTVVAFGTSAPELSVSLISSLHGSGGMSVGNVLGSNIFNILAILGITALIVPLPVTKPMQRFDIPIAIVGALLLILVLVDLDFDGAPSILTRSEGIILLCFAYLFIRYTIYMGKKGSSRNEEVETQVKTMSTPKSALWIILGLAGLVAGGQLFVTGASDIAKTLGVSDTIIGLTIVAWGTSLPELATSIVAAIKRNTDIALGNVIGSNIFNIFIVLGLSATISPMHNLAFTWTDLLLQLGATLLLLIFGRYIQQGVIARWQGAIMLTIFIAYNGLLISQALQ